MTKEEMVGGFNKWMAEYIKNPKEFLETQQEINNYLCDRLDGKEPTYGQCCAATLAHYAMS